MRQFGVSSGLLILAGICLAVAQQPPSKSDAAAQNTQIDAPWMADVSTKFNNGDMGRCDATLIHPRAVLTAAFCVDSYPTITVRVGLRDLKNPSDAVQIRTGVPVIHPKYQYKNLWYNFAVIILSEPITRGTAAFVSLPAADAPLDFSEYFSTGWSKYGSALKIVHPTFIHDSECRELLGQNSVDLDSSLFCSHGGNSMSECKGSSGTPLIHRISENPPRYEQVGLLSWNTHCYVNQPRYPVAWSKVALAREWIDSILSLL